MSGHTYSGHPLSCAAALRVLQVVEEDNLLSNVNEMGKYIKHSLEKLKQENEIISIVRGKGLLLGVEFDPQAKGFQAKLIERCYQNGLLVYPAVGGKEGTDENGILVSPPFIISKQESDELLEKFTTSLKECK